METKTYFFDLHADHITWLKGLDFYTDELEVFKNRLAEVSTKNSSVEVKKEVEKYQNKFIIQKNEIDNLKHYIHGSEREMEEEIKKNPVALDHRKTIEDTNIRDKMEMFVKLFAELKVDFNEFAGRNM